MRVRQPLLNYFAKHPIPVSAIELIAVFPVNKTTVYRELEYLLHEKLIIEIDFGDGIKRYELSDLGHEHHYLACANCRKQTGYICPNCH